MAHPRFTGRSRRKVRARLSRIRPGTLPSSRQPHSMPSQSRYCIEQRHGSNTAGSRTGRRFGPGNPHLAQRTAIRCIVKRFISPGSRLVFAVSLQSRLFSSTASALARSVLHHAHSAADRKASIRRQVAESAVSDPSHAADDSTRRQVLCSRLLAAAPLRRRL